MATVITNSTITIDGNTIGGTNINADSATITNLTGTNVTADSATITNLNTTSGNINADSATITNLTGTNLSGTNVTASGDIKGSSFNGGQLGGRRNFIINGAMQVAQRGTSFACPAGNDTYTMDRFVARPAVSTASTVTQVTDAPVGFQYSARVTRNSGQTGTLTRFETPFETRDIVNLREKKVTVSFYAKAGSNLSTNSNAISLVLYAGNGTERARTVSGYDNESFMINSSKTLTTSWQRFTHTTSSAVASDTTQLAVQFQALWTGTAGSNDEFFITGIQLEAGETATPFENRSYGEELALCQRYYEICAVMFNGDGVGGANFIIPQKVTKRTTPTATNTGTTGGYSYNWTFSSIGSSFNDMVVEGVSSSGAYRAHRYGITLDAEL